MSVASAARKPSNTATAPAAKGGERIASLDGVRGIAILLVLVHHHVYGVDHSNASPVVESIAKAVAFAYLGVDVFFVLSGFLIGGIILRGGSEPGFRRRFYLRRAARLFPIYLLVLGLYVVFEPALLASRTVSGDALARGGVPLWSYLLYVQNLFMSATHNFGSHWLASTWSLAVEEQFYLIAPTLILLVPRRWLAVLLIGLACIAPVTRTLMFDATQSWIPGYVTLFARWDALLIGVLGALACETPACRQWLADNRRAMVMGFAALSILILPPLLLSEPSDRHMAVYGFTLAALWSLGLICMALFANGGLLARVLCWRPLVGLGVISYGLYLIHVPVLWVAFWLYDGGAPRLHTAAGATLTIAAALMSIALAALSWRYLERPILALAHTLASPKLALPSASQALDMPPQNAPHPAAA